MKGIFLLLLFCGLALPGQGRGQTYAKLNTLYAIAGVVNPAVEFPLSARSTFQCEIVWSPWQSVTIQGHSGPMKFGLLLNEYRRYFGSRNNGWYAGAHLGAAGFNLTKPYWQQGLHLQQKSGKGYGMLFGATIGYERLLGRRWLIDASFGWAFMSSFYNGYSLVDGLIEGDRIYDRGELILYPHGHTNDPFNGSAEWLPSKIGISIGYRIFGPEHP
jgi:hypothetical protein